MAVPRGIFRSLDINRLARPTLIMPLVDIVGEFRTMSNPYRYWSLRSSEAIGRVIPKN